MSSPFEAARDHFLRGTALLEQGQPAAAAQALQASLALVPGRPSTLSNLGVAQLRLDQPAQALDSLDQALAAAPDVADSWCHRAEALMALDRALALDAHHVAAHHRRALALNQLGRHGDALQALDTLLAAQPALAPAWLLRGQTLQALQRHAEALPAYQRAVALAPDLAAGWSLLGQLLQDDPARRDEAHQAFTQALAHGADPVLHGYFLAALGSGTAPPASPAGYVRGLFDHYADDFEPHLLDVLHYRAHQAVVAAAAPLCTAPLASALDLGCGTGLCGPLLRPLAQRVHGVDLSPTMLERARQRGSYDALTQDDIVEHLRTTPERHGLVVAADVFIYLGDLAPVFAGVRRLLQPGGVFAFSVERTPGDGYRLQPSLRYAHAEPYLRALAAQHGFTVASLQATILREDQRRPIAGYVVCLRAP